HVSPRPLYPTSFPDQIVGADATFQRHGPYFSITYTTGPVDDSLTSIVVFERAPASSLAQTIRFQRAVQRHPVRRVRIGRRQLYFYNGDITFGYVWREQGYTYFVKAHCCLSSRITARQL